MDTNTKLKAQPNDYVFDETSGLYVGRINKDGTEDRRFINSGACSLMNGLIKATSYTPKDPQEFARLYSKPNNYILSGFTIICDCLELTPEMWAAEAASLAEISDTDNLRDILDHISKLPKIEWKAKMSALAYHFAKTLKSHKMLSPSAFQEFQITMRFLGYHNPDKLEKDHQWIKTLIETKIIDKKNLLFNLERLLKEEEPTDVFMSLFNIYSDRWMYRECSSSATLHRRINAFLNVEGYDNLLSFIKDKYKSVIDETIKEQELRYRLDKELIEDYVKQLDALKEDLKD